VKKNDGSSLLLSCTNSKMGERSTVPCTNVESTSEEE